MMKLTEKYLHRFWQTSRYFSRPLALTDEKKVDIIRRGRYNSDSGPDFRDATIRVDAKLMQGDVEIHLDARDWFQHGHDRDPAYNAVILHVALDSVPPPAAITRENGSSVLQLIVPATEVGATMTPKLQGTARLPFADCPLHLQPVDKIVATVQKGGLLRFQQKVDRFQEQLESKSWDQLLYQGICEALGYSKNRKPFRKLAEIIPIDLLFSELREVRETDPEMLVSAMLFGAAGLLQAAEAPGVPDADIAGFLEPRQALWHELRYPLQITPMQRAEWQFFRLRPQNFPTRRIAAVAKLVLKFYRLGMIETLLARLDSREQKDALIIRELHDAFAVPADDFWQYYYDFRSRAMTGQATKLGHLVGDRRAHDLVLNVVLPILMLFARETGNAYLQNRILEIYSSYPKLQENVVTRKMRQQLFPQGRLAKSEVAGARFQQGLLHLSKNFCQPLFCDSCLRISLLSGR